ncbi:hypothetical protein Goarm_022608 [Gossypium armourianum]|uniref:Uncharacterized protein n=1 Tax=Gossypium armourianum TaxID=34283 RepID=A0A7J9KDT4_9ROSI|nr:hypothetical protein [Gossypium armourianum]
MWEWLTWVFSRGTSDQCRLFCCGHWLIWTYRNRLIYERKSTTGGDISKQIYSYISELDGIEEKNLTLKIDRDHKHVDRRMRVTIYFDIAFDH